MKSTLILALSLTLAALGAAQTPPPVGEPQEPPRGGDPKPSGSEPIILVTSHEANLQIVVANDLCYKEAENLNSQDITVSGSRSADVTGWVRGGLELEWLVKRLNWDPKFATITSSNFRMTAPWSVTLKSNQEGVAGYYFNLEANISIHPTQGPILVPGNERFVGEYGNYDDQGKWHGTPFDVTRQRLWPTKFYAKIKARTLHSELGVNDEVSWSEFDALP